MAELDSQDPTTDLAQEFQLGLEGLPAAETRTRLARIEHRLTELAAKNKVYGPIYDEIIHLKYLHQRYTNYLSWLESQM